MRRFWIILLVLPIILAGLAIYTLINQFEVEIARAQYDLIEKQARATAEIIAGGLARSFTELQSGRLDLDNLQKALWPLVNEHQNVALVIVENPQRRPLAWAPSRNPRFDPFLNRLGELFAGNPAAAQINDDRLSREFPSFATVTREIYDRYTGRLLARMYIFIDQNPPSENPFDTAAKTMRHKLALVVILLGILVAIVGSVINRQRRTAKRLRLQRDRAEQLAYVGTLASGLAHEIRNPINALAMQLEMLEEDVENGQADAVAPRLHRVRDGLIGVERSVQDFLTFAVPGQQRPAMIDLSPVVETVCREHEEIARDSSVEISRQIAPGLHAWCDSHALQQILGNLISNALRIQRGRPGPPRLRVEAVRQDHWIDLMVEDAGPGVPAEFRERIFDCFYTTQSDGSGLGLAIARRLAEMNGGSLSLDDDASALGGARFRLRLPTRPVPPSR